MVIIGQLGLQEVVQAQKEDLLFGAIYQYLDSNKQLIDGDYNKDQKARTQRASEHYSIHPETKSLQCLHHISHHVSQIMLINKP